MTKKKICFMMAVLIIFSICFHFISFGQSVVKAHLAGTSVVRNYNTITVTFSLESVAATGVQGCIEYNPDMLTFVSHQNICDRDFELQTNVLDGKIYFVMYQRNVDLKLFGNKNLFTVTFQVGRNLQGKTISVKATNLVATNSDYSIAVKDATYSCIVSASVPYRTRLNSLEISDGVLEPAFDPAQTEYSVTVGYDISNITINATANYHDSIVDVSNVTLAAGVVTKLYVRVSAADSYTDYVINVFRIKSPDLQLSNDTAVTAISLSEGKLTPDFDNAVTEYSVTVGADVEQLEVSVAMQSDKAYYVVNNNEKLSYGHNNVVILLTAEDEYTTRKIVLDVVREKASSDMDAISLFQGDSLRNIFIAVVILVLSCTLVIVVAIKAKKNNK